MMQTLIDFINWLGYFGLFALALGFIIFVHELGHFLTAKWAGVRVTQFAIGFGHAAVSWRKGLGFRIGSSEVELERRLREHMSNSGRERAGDEPLTNEEICQAADELGVSETEYRFNWIPLGGYVKMLGQEDLDPSKVSKDQRSFNNAPIWKRMIIISAGVIMNMIFAVIFFIAAFMIGIKYPPAMVGDIAPDSPAATTIATHHPDIVGMQPGDRIVAINGSKPSDFNSLVVASALTRTGQTLTLTVDRPAFGDQPSQQLEFVIKPELGGAMKMLQIGVSQPSTLQLQQGDPELGISEDDAIKMLKDTGLDLQPGWTLKSVNGQPVTALWQYTRMVRDSGGKKMKLVFADDAGAEHSVTIQPASDTQATDVQTIEGQPKETIANLLGLAPAVKVTGIVEHSAADGVLKEGDVIAQIGNIPWPTLAQLHYAVANQADPSLDIIVIRDGQRVKLSATPKNTRILFGRKLLGISYTWDTDDVILGGVVPGSPLDKLDIAPGSVIAAVNGQPVHNWNELRIALQQAGESVTLDIHRPLLGGVDQQITAKISDDDHKALAALAWVDPIGVFAPERELQKADTPVQALSMGFDKTMLFLEQTYVTFLRLADQSLSPKQLSGPVGIASIGTKMAHRGFAYLMYFAGLISVNLAVVNFLPLPIVDGGLFVMLLIEKARGKPLPLGVQSAIAYIGLVLLGAIFLFVTFNDIVRIVNG